MVKLRLSGTIDEIKEILYKVQEWDDMQVMMISEPYKDRNSVYSRVYIEMRKINENE